MDKSTLLKALKEGAEWTDQQYRSYPALGGSSISNLLVGYNYAMEPLAETADMYIGTYIHALVLEPHKASDRFLVASEHISNRLTTEYKNLKYANPDKTILLDSEHALSQTLANMILDGKLLGDYDTLYCEAPLIASYNCALGTLGKDITIKGKFDALRFNEADGSVDYYELKFTRDVKVLATLRKGYLPEYWLLQMYHYSVILQAFGVTNINYNVVVGFRGSPQFITVCLFNQGMVLGNPMAVSKYIKALNEYVGGYKPVVYIELGM